MLASSHLSVALAGVLGTVLLSAGCGQLFNTPRLASRTGARFAAKAQGGSTSVGDGGGLLRPPVVAGVVGFLAECGWLDGPGVVVGCRCDPDGLVMKTEVAGDGTMRATTEAPALATSATSNRQFA